MSEQGLEDNHVAPMRSSTHKMGEIKATGTRIYRLYYGEPTEQVDLVVGLCVREKRRLRTERLINMGQDKDIKVARNIFVTWLKANGMTATR